MYIYIYIISIYHIYKSISKKIVIEVYHEIPSSTIPRDGLEDSQIVSLAWLETKSIGLLSFFTVKVLNKGHRCLIWCGETQDILRLNRPGEHYTPTPSAWNKFVKKNQLGYYGIQGWPTLQNPDSFQPGTWLHDCQQHLQGQVFLFWFLGQILLTPLGSVVILRKVFFWGGILLNHTGIDPRFI